MASFYSVLGFLAVGPYVNSDLGSFDVLSSLPVEMALTVLRLLPAKDLLNVVLVSTKWLLLCKSDPKLRQRVRRYLRQMRRLRLAVLMGQEPQVRGRESARGGPVMSNLTNAMSSSRMVNGGPSSTSGSRVPLLYQHDLVQKPRKRKIVKSVNFPAKKLRI